MAKSPSALTSPSLGSTSTFDWSNGGPITPDASGPRLVQKQVVRVKGTASEALIVLYLKLAVPRTSNTQTVELFPDDGVILKSSQVYSVNVVKGKTLIPPDASRSLQRASEILSISRTNAFASSVGDETSLSSTEKTFRSAAKRAKITTSNFQVSFVVPPDTDQSTSKVVDDKAHFVAIIHLSISYASKPPKWPYVVHIPLPRCLNNYLNFSIDESCATDNTIVEVDPPLLPKPTPMSIIKSKLESELGLSRVNGHEAAAEDEQILSGPFYSTPTLCIRWARADAGMVEDAEAISHRDYRPIRGDLLDIHATYSNFRKMGNNLVEIDVQANIILSGIHYPGLDPTPHFNLHLSPISDASWKDNSVSLTTTAWYACSLQSYSTIRPGRFSKHTVQTLSSNGAKVDRMPTTPSPQPFRDDSLEVNQEPDNTIDEEGNLLNVRPPRGLTSPLLDLGFDSDDDEVDSSILLVPSKMNNRRHSLGLRPPDAKSSEIDSNTKTPLDNGANRSIYTTLSLTALRQVGDEFRCKIQATIQLKTNRIDDKITTIALPIVRANEIALQYKATAKGCRIDQKGNKFNVLDSSEDAIYKLSLTAHPSNVEVRDTMVEVNVDLSDVKEEDASGDINSAATTLPHDRTRSASDDSLDFFANKSLEINQEYRRNSIQREQVDSLSGMIQEACVEVYSTVILQEGLLPTENVQKKVKTTHVIRFSWPSTTVPSSNTLCGSLLPQIVLALPYSEGDDLQILYASVNGLYIQIGEISHSGTTQSESSRIVDIRLPDSLKDAIRVEAFLLYTRVTKASGTLCIFPAVASSIAELKVAFYYSAFDCEDPTVTFSNAPVNSSFCTEPNQKKEILAHMLPSMTSMRASLTTRMITPIAITTSAQAPLRRTAKKSSKSWRRLTLVQSASIFHLFCTILLALALVGTILAFEPVVESLSRKVDSLAMALDVDFSEGTWKPDASASQQVYIDKRDAILSSDPISHKDKTVFVARDISEKTEFLHAQTITKEPHELSTDTRSFALLLETLSSNLTRSISWPFRLLYALFRR